MKRTSNTQLPSADEIRQMIEKESQRRAVRRDYLQKHPEVFQAYREVAKEAGIDISIVDNFLQIDFDDTIRQLEVMTEAMTDYLSANPSQDKAIKLYGPLNYQTELENSDLILVFGSPSNLRVAKAVELYHAGIAPKLLLTGAAPHWGSNQVAEADSAADYAIKNGVAPEDIIIERQSIQTPDNAKRAVDLLEEMSWQPKSITIATSAFHLRRAIIELYKFANWAVKIQAAAPQPSQALNQNNWILTDRGRRTILNEYAKFIVEAKVDQVLAERLY